MKYSINSNTTTNILFESNIVDNIEQVKILKQYWKVLILTERKIYDRYLSYISQLNNERDIKFFIYFVEEGDFTKNYEIKQKIDEFLFENSFDTSSCICGIFY